MAICDEEDRGMMKINSNYYEWRLTKERWLAFRVKTTTMYRSNNERHCSLDSDSIENKDVQVILSMNEYPLDFWKKHSIK